MSPKGDGRPEKKGNVGFNGTARHVKKEGVKKEVKKLSFLETASQSGGKTTKRGGGIAGKPQATGFIRKGNQIGNAWYKMWSVDGGGRDRQET